MSKDYLRKLDGSRRHAVDELIALVREHYPAASFRVAQGEEDPEITHIFATIDRDDPDEVTDLTIERELALLDEGIPVYVIPLRTPKREAAVVRRMEQERREGTALTMRFL